MSQLAGATIRSIFSNQSPIDREIEKVIDYAADDGERLKAEVSEYQVTDSVENNLRRFVDHYGQGVRTGQVTETGIWVSGFYGSGKSSFTKYLGFALDSARMVGDTPFVDLFCERIRSTALGQELKTLAQREPAAVVMLDLGSQQLATSSAESVARVLYWKVLQSVGFAKEAKLAQLELFLDKEGKLKDFEQAFETEFGQPWSKSKGDPLVGVARAGQIVSRFYPKEYPDARAFTSQQFQLTGTVEDLAKEMLELIRRKTGRKNVLFLIDEVGQYVAPRSELILNLDGLARALKELGQGRVWIVATGQQTLSEVVEKAIYNSQQLFKLRDRFPINIELDASDIKEIVWRRLLTKSAEGSAVVTGLFRQHGASLATHTRLSGTALFKRDPDEESFSRFYPFLPHHFELLLTLIGRLAAGGVGLRSAIRVVQDLLVDFSRSLPDGTQLLADRELGSLATADLFYDTLRADVARSHAHIVAGVERVRRIFPDDPLVLRVAKAIAVLQPMEESFPRSPENLAALLYTRVGAPPVLDSVRSALQRMLEEKEVGLAEDPQSGGYGFLSEAVQPLREQRDRYQPSVAEVAREKSEILKGLFQPQPSATIEGGKGVRAAVVLDRNNILVGGDEEIQLRLQLVDAPAWDRRRAALLTETTGNADWQNAIAWLARVDDDLENFLAEAVKSQEAVRRTRETDANRDVAQFLRSEQRLLDHNRDQARKLLSRALMEGTLIFRGEPRPAANLGADIEAASRKQLQDAGLKIYSKFYLAVVRASTELAAQFLQVERLDRMTTDKDPLSFVVKTSGSPHVNPEHQTLAEVLRVFETKLQTDGTTRLQGQVMQDLLAAPPFGWSKDTTRYIFAALLTSGSIVFHGASEIKTPGPAAIDAVKSTVAFNRVGIALRDSRPSMETLDRAANRLELMFGKSVLPLEDHISRAVRELLPAELTPLATLAVQLNGLDLAGASRAQGLWDTGLALQAEDGAAAIGILGANDSSFPGDLAWAKKTVQALADGAGQAVRAARDTLRNADGIARYFPQSAPDVSACRQVVNDVAASEDFYARLGDLRAAERQAREQAAASYRQQREAYLVEVGDVRSRLESSSSWLRLADEDRTDIIHRLDQPVEDLPEVSLDGQEFPNLQSVLTYRLGLAATERQLAEEVERRLPEPSEEEPLERLVDVFALLPMGPLTTSEELESWLGGLKQRLEQELSEGPIRLQVHL